MVACFTSNRHGVRHEVLSCIFVQYLVSSDVISLCMKHPKTLPPVYSISENPADIHLTPMMIPTCVYSAVVQTKNLRVWSWDRKVAGCKYGCRELLEKGQQKDGHIWEMDIHTLDVLILFLI